MNGVERPQHGNRWTHVAAAVVIPGCLALGTWQVLRALGGNSLSWAYVFEWPLFAGYAVYMWWRLVHERPVPTADAAPDTDGGAGAAPEDAPREDSHGEDAELAAYNEYLARLAERDRALGR